jgi:hypothetical protein
VADIFRRHGEAFRAAQGGRLLEIPVFGEQG